MLLRFGKLCGALVLLLALWGLSRVRGTHDSPWVQLPGTSPGQVRILLFQASVGTLIQGEKATLCYGVSNAKSVRISPAAVHVYPAANRCLEIVPQHTTHYTLLAEGFDGSMATKSFTLTVQPAAAQPSQPLEFAAIWSAQNDQPQPQPE
ncbi:MAG: hypothetical protein C5B51_11100 [Terriglobia bacterium]|nr:MAG: hypothetical protein C5B51_11100 [Terriglobia bacterium]